MGARVERARRRHPPLADAPAPVARGQPADAVRPRAEVRELVQPGRGRARRAGVRAREELAGADVDGAYPPTCTPQSTGLDCPSAQLLASSYSGGDFTDRDWTIQVRDDDIAAGEYYDPEDVPNNAHAGTRTSNGKMWVRADARAADGNRTVVALVKRIDTTIPFPRNAITAGWFQSTNNGNKVIVDTKGERRAGGARRGPLSQDGHPAASSTGRVRYRLTPRRRDTPATRSCRRRSSRCSVRRRRRSTPTTHRAAPRPTSPERWSSSRTATAGTPAAARRTPPPSRASLVIANGTLYLGGNVTFYGLVYAANLQRSTGEIVRTQGAATIVGSVAVDGGGGVSVGLEQAERGLRRRRLPEHHVVLRSRSGAGILARIARFLSPGRMT